MLDNTNNKAFWNNYVTYWENRVKETNEGKEVKDRTSDDSVLESYFKQLKVENTDKFLDYGCGSGRLYPIYEKHISEGINNYIGLDISKVCLEHAAEKYKGLKIGDNLKEFDGIDIPFSDNVFDKIFVLEYLMCVIRKWLSKNYYGY